MTVPYMIAIFTTGFVVSGFGIPVFVPRLMMMGDIKHSTRALFVIALIAWHVALIYTIAYWTWQ